MDIDLSSKFLIDEMLSQYSESKGLDFYCIIPSRKAEMSTKGLSLASARHRFENK